MKIEYVAFDSFGVKSSSVRIVTKDVSVVIDPGIAIETDSFPLSLPQRIALEAKYAMAIKKACAKSDVIVITHYHYDHHRVWPSMYKGKILLIKDPKRNINKSQRGRAAYLLEQIKGLPKEIKIADGKIFRFDKTKIKFSRPLWHGVPRTRLGRVIMCSVSGPKKKLLHSSDIDGPVIEEYADLIVKEKPNVLILDGAPTYILGYIMSHRNLERCVKNTIKIVKGLPKGAKIILDHHLLRDYRFKEIYHEAYKLARERGITVHTAAEEIKKKPVVLEAYKKYGPTKWRRWEKFTWTKFKEVKAHAEKVALKKARKK